MNALILILVLVFMIIALIVSFYLLVYYCHPGEKGFGSSTFCKVLVVSNLNFFILKGSWIFALLGLNINASFRCYSINVNLFL